MIRPSKLLAWLAICAVSALMWLTVFAFAFAVWHAHHR